VICLIYVQVFIVLCALELACVCKKVLFCKKYIGMGEKTVMET